MSAWIWSSRACSWSTVCCSVARCPSAVAAVSRAHSRSCTHRTYHSLVAPHLPHVEKQGETQARAVLKERFIMNNIHNFFWGVFYSRLPEFRGARRDLCFPVAQVSLAVRLQRGETPLNVAYFTVGPLFVRNIVIILNATSLPLRSQLQRPV